MAESILVAGGAGFIGSHLVDALVRAGHRVRIYDSLDTQVHLGLRESGQWPDYLAWDCERVLGDVRDCDSLQRAIDGIDIVFHQAAVVGVGQSMYEIERYVDLNTRGHKCTIGPAGQPKKSSAEADRRFVNFHLRRRELQMC